MHIQSTATGKKQGRFPPETNKQAKQNKQTKNLYSHRKKSIPLDIHLNAAVLYFVTKTTDSKLVVSHT